MKTLANMAQSIASDAPSFARLTGSRRSSSWTIALPATFLAVALVVLMAWLAARASSRQAQLETLQRDAAASQQTLAAAQKQVQTVQSQLELARDPGRTTVVLQASAPAGRSAKGAVAANSSWGAAAWGESNGKSWVRLNAYGLVNPPQGKSLIVWFAPLQGAPVSLGKLEPSPSGTAQLEAKDLPGVDQGKRLFASVEAENAKAPVGPVLFGADLPKLVPQSKPLPPAPPPGSPAGADAPAAGATR